MSCAARPRWLLCGAMTAEELFLARMRSDPRADVKRAAREAGVSSRAARRLIAVLETEGVLRSRRRRHVAVGVLVLGALAGTAYLLFGKRREAASPSSRALSPEVKEKEKELYAALDRKDPARVAAAKAELASSEEVVRLAALRYLATVNVAEHAEQLRPLFDDSSERVRSVALQLVGAAPGREVEAGLVQVLRSEDRPLAERLLAVSKLRERRASRTVAPEVLPVLLDSSQALREETSLLLAQLTSKQVAAGSGDAKALHAAWREALGVSE